MRLAARALVLLALLAALLVAAAIWMSGRLDEATAKARIAQMVRRATGRTLILDGRLTWRVGPEIVIDADDASLANPPGFSRPALLRARHVRARVALLPLLRREIVLDRLELTAPDLKLERVGGLAANWARPPPPTQPDRGPPRPSSPPPGATTRPWRLTVLGLTVTDGVVAWAWPGRAGAIGIAHASLLEANARSSIAVDLAASMAGDPVVISGAVGAQTHLWSRADHTPWPVRLRLDSAAGDVTVEGTVARPREAAGYDVAITARGPDLGRLGAVWLGAIWPGLTLPRLRDAALTARLVDRGGPVPVVTRLALGAGASDLGNLVPGLMLDRLDLTAPNLTGESGLQNNRLRASGRFAGQTLNLAGTLGPLRGRPVPLQATLLAAGATLEVAGQVAPGDGASTLTLGGKIPDLAALSAFAQRRLPRLHDLVLAGTIAGTARQIAFRAVSVTGPAGALRFDGSLAWAARPTLAGTIRVQKLDIDAVAAAWPTPVAAAPTQADPDAGVALAHPDPLGVRIDADLQLAAATLLWRGVTLTDAAAHLVLDHGAVRLDPLAFSLDGKTLTGAAAFDPPAATSLTLRGARLTLRGAGLPLAALVMLAKPGQIATGAVDLDLALTGSGQTAAALAGSLAGHADVTLVGGTVGRAMAAAVLHTLLPGSPLDGQIEGEGQADIACAGARADVAGGLATLPIVYLDLGRARLAAAGTADLRAGTIALRLLPYVKLGGSGLVVPLRASGNWRQPVLRPEPSTAKEDPLLRIVDRADCAAALAVARGGALPTAFPPARVAAKTAKPKRTQPGALLRQLRR